MTMTGVLCTLWCFLQLVAAERFKPMVEGVHVKGVFTTLAGDSPVYVLPTWECPLTVFGVRAESDVHLHLIRPIDSAILTISIQVSKYHGETQLTNFWENLGSMPTTIVTRDLIELDPDTFTWFTVYRRNDFIGLFLEDEVRLVLAYKLENKMVNFLRYTCFQVSSYYDAEWDFLGDQYPGLGKGPGYLRVVKEVQAAAKGLIHRLMMLEHVLDVKPLDSMPVTTKTAFFTQLRRTEAFIFLCRFYGFDFVKQVKFFPWKRLKAAFKELHEE